MRATAIKRLKQGHTIWVVRLDTDAIKHRNECIWIVIPYLVMSKNYIRKPSYQSDRQMNINAAKSLIENQDPLRYGVLLSRRAALKFRNRVTNYWAGQTYSQ